MNLKHRPMAIIGFTVAVVLMISIYAYSECAIISIALGIVLLVTALAFEKIRVKIFPFFLSLALMLSGAMYFTSDIRNTDVSEYAGKEYDLCGRICADWTYNNSRYYYTLDKVILNGKEIDTKLKLSVPDKIDAELYDNITINSVKTYSVGKTSSSAKLYYNSLGIYIGAYPTDEEACSITVTYNENRPLMYYFVKANNIVTSRVLEKLPNEYGSITVAMLTGNKDYMSDKTVEMYTEAGIAPLFAVSGFHLSVWILGLYEILRSFGVRKRINSFIGVATTLCFMALTGFSASVCRAGIMMIIMLVGNLFYRKPDSVNSLGLAVLIMCIINPLNASNVGFLLSVTATLGIVTLYPIVEKFVFSKFPEALFYAVFKAILSVVAVCVCAVIGALPITILFIGNISVMSVFSNLAVSYVAGFCMFFGGMTALVYPVGLLSSACAFMCEYTAKYIYNVIKFVDSLDVPLITTSDIYWQAGAILCMTVIVSVLFINEKLRCRIMCVGLTAVIVACSVLSYLHYDGLTTVSLLDVENSILIVASDSNGKIVLCNDTAYEYYTDDALDKIDSVNNKSVDLLLVPTYDSCINSEILRLALNDKIDNIIMPYEPQELSRRNKSVVRCNSGCFEVLNSGTINYLYTDDYSLALCTFDTVRLLVIFDSVTSADIPNDYLEADILVCCGYIPYSVDITEYNEVIGSAGETVSASIHKYVNNNGIPAVTTAESGNIDIEIKNQDYKIKVGV